MGLPQLFKNIQIDLQSKTLLYDKCKNQLKKFQKQNPIVL